MIYFTIGSKCDIYIIPEYYIIVGLTMADSSKLNDQIKCVQALQVAILPLTKVAKNGISHTECLLISLKGQITR
jgi:hypothetical protein